MIEIKYKSFGILKTNCYLLSNNYGTLIIDPGHNASEWVIDNINRKPVAILNTHGHYDHVYSNNTLQNKLNIPLIIHEEDRYLLQNDEFNVGLPKSIPDFTYEGDKEFCIGDFKFKAIHLPGHSHGTSIYDFGEFILTGDFVMPDTVGRYNLHTSDKNKKFKSLKKYLDIYQYREDAKDIVIYSGHGDPFTLEESLKTVEKWLTFFN